MESRLYILAAALLWSSAGAAIKLCALDGWQIAGGRSAVAGLFFLLAVPTARRRPTRALLATGLAYALTVVLFVNATKLTTAANAIFLQSTAPLWVLILSPWLLRERPSRAELLAVPVFGAGMALFLLDEISAGQALGNAVALASGVAFGFCIVGLRRLRDEAPGALAWGNLLAAALCAPFAFSGPTPTALDAGLVLFLGVFQLGLSYLAFSRGLLGTPALEASLLTLLEPVLNPVWTFLVAGERPGRWALAGGAVVLAATAWRTLAPVVAARLRR